jgi:hypothetical protein
MPTLALSRELAELDRDIAQAMQHLHVARRRCEHSPSSQAIADMDSAERYLNQLLDQRLTMTSDKANG